MNLRAFGRPSIAKEFFLKITGDSDPVAAIKRLLNATPPTFETEWLDFKGAAQINDQDAKKTWSKALAGFANTQGGVLIWGVDARKDQTTGIDAACGQSLVKNPSAFKSRLNELHHQATEPPVLDVEIEAYPIAGTDEGFVVCYIPESRFKPHRAEHADRQYYIRAGDDFVVPSVSLLRNLFFPQSRCRLMPKLTASCTVENGQTRYDFKGFLQNLGAATAFDTLVITNCNPNYGTTCGITNWDTDPSGDPRYKSTKTPIHPGISRPFFAMIFFPQYNPQDFANGLEFKIQVFARDAEPVEWLISFTEAEIKTGCEKNGKYRALLFPL